MGLESPQDAMPWVGLYVFLASLICTLAMAADAIQAIRQWKLWFPNKLFTLNASTITLIAIAMKLPADLTMTDPEWFCSHVEDVKKSGIHFLVTMLANFLPSLGLMDDRELLMKIVALGILLISIVVNMGIQVFTQVIDIYEIRLPIFIFAFVLPFSIALTVSASRRKLERRYKESQQILYEESQQMVSSVQEESFSYEVLSSYVKKYWMMTETRNPQFVIACSPVSSAFGVICIFVSFISGAKLVQHFFGRGDYRVKGCFNTDYKWSLEFIFIVQLIGIVVGSIAPIFRCLSSVGHYNLSKKWSKNRLNVFRVEQYWCQLLQQWKHMHVHPHIPGHYSKIVFHNLKNIFLNFCISLHILVLVLCKIICLVPGVLLIILSHSWFLIKSCLKWFQKITNTPPSNGSSEIQHYNKFVEQIEEDATLTDRLLRNTLRFITRIINASETYEPRNLMLLLQKSEGFNGVAKFENDRVPPLPEVVPPPLHQEVPPLHQEGTANCWSLVIVTLTSIAIALPKTETRDVKSLLSSIREGLEMVSHIEECLDEDGDILETRKATKRVWPEVEVYRSWLQIDLQKMARKGETTEKILRWLGDEAVKIVRKCKSSKRPSIDQSPYKFLLASSMYKISQSMLLQCDEKLFDSISTIIADIFFACFTNLPRVITMKCHHHAIEKRGDNIRNAAELLVKSKKILKILEKRKLPNLDLDSRAYIDKWRLLPEEQIRNQIELQVLTNHC